MRTLFKYTETCCWFDRQYDFNAENIIRDDVLEDRDIRANIITQSFLIYDAGDNFETKFCFKQGYMTSHFFCRKAPFTLITNQILDLIKRNITFFSTTSLMISRNIYVMLIKGGFPGNADFSHYCCFLAFLKSKWWG